MALKILFTNAACTALLLCFCLSLCAQSPSPTIDATPTPVNQSRENPEVIALRAQLEVMRQYDQRLLETVYWSLGGMLTVVIVIVGVGWYTNFRLYERDKIALAKEIKSEMQASLESVAREAGKTAVAQVLTDIRDAQHKLLKMEAEEWERKGVHANALEAQLKMIEMAPSARALL